ncbi:tetratricopeptide repeat protein 36-like [Hydra vulgaris]|uniref:Tetratricopeptide repeat protein 36-like n=1 Tax=Hydra vulgaris TaxID=6087 RepID=A0ABM4C2R3_HYDVU
MGAEETDLTEKDEIVLHAIFNPNTPLDLKKNIAYIHSGTNADNETTPELKKIELEAVKLAQAQNFEESLKLFNQLINETPSYASAYNNRAQLYRILGKTDLAMEDLNKTIIISESKGFIASQAFVQRAILFKVNGDDENALIDFKSAAELGNQFAKNQLVALNPYAALCNKMLSEAFCKLYGNE